VAIALIALCVVAGAWTVRARRRVWDQRAHRICACSVETVARLRQGARAAPEPLDEVMSAQARVLDATCADLRRAVRERPWTATLRERPLRVPPTVEHDRASEALRASLRSLCAPERDAAWSRDPAQDERGILPAALVAVANELRRMRAALCARQTVLAGAPEPYTLTAAQADEAARTCGAAPR
jgi:hypothetical protein